MMPAKLRATPPAFLRVTGSLITMAATIIVYMGDMAVMMEMANAIDRCPLAKKLLQLHAMMKSMKD